MTNANEDDIMTSSSQRLAKFEKERSTNMKTESKIKSKTMFPLENKQETEEIMQFCSELSEDEQRELLNFIRGARFAKSLQQKTA